MINNYIEYIMQDLKQKNPAFNEEEERGKYEDIASKNVKWYLIKSELVKENKITVSNKDLDQKIENFVKENKQQKKEITEFYKKEENLNNLYEQLINEKLFNLINEFAVNKISEKSTSDLRKDK